MVVTTIAFKGNELLLERLRCSVVLARNGLSDWGGQVMINGAGNGETTDTGKPHRACFHS